MEARLEEARILAEGARRALAAGGHEGIAAEMLRRSSEQTRIAAKIAQKRADRNAALARLRSEP